MSEISLTRLVYLINELKLRIEKYNEKLAKNEMLVRYMLVDPFLRALGWNLENPEEVEPEYVVESGRADYAIKHGGRIVAFIEAKPLSGISKKVIKEKLKYAFDSGVEFTVITDGDTWLVYETFKKAEWRDKKLSEWSITREEPAVVALKALILANTSAFGRQPEKPVLERRVTTTAETAIAEQVRVFKVKGPVDWRKAEYLVLKILASAEKPYGRREIIEKAREHVELTEKDSARTKSGEQRWITQIRWAITRLKMKGKVRALGRNAYAISEEGKSFLKTLEEQIKATA
uniref:Restriction system protein Mrr-like N-terminal domain-containing protein n=1 Tax=Staphylothermus marinus TaxID=2280 RepID=A0A7J3KGJ0_STAMA